MSDELRRYTYDPLRDRDPGCKWPKCGKASDGSLDGEPYCATHADAILERWIAVSLAPQVADMLPGLWDS